MKRNAVSHEENPLLETLRNRKDVRKFYELLYKSHSKKMLAIASMYRKKESFYNNEDILQEVFKRLLGKEGFKPFEKCEDEKCIWNTLKKITINECINRCKKEQRRQTSDIDDSVLAKFLEKAGANNIMLSKDLNLLKKELTDYQKLVVHLKVQDYTFKEIAEQLDIGVSAAKERYYSALQKLKEVYPLYFVD